MDANLETDGMLVGLVNELWSIQERLILRYTHVPMQRTLIVVDETTWMLKLHELITDKKKVMIGFRSKTQMKSITTWLMNNHTNTLES
jgi:hypothetical protein